MFEIAYVLGLLLLYPVYVGTIASEMRYNKSARPDASEYFLAAVFSVGIIWFWPLLVPGFYAVKVLQARNSDYSFLRFVFPVAPTPKSAKERQAAKELKERTARQEIALARARINNLERENSVPLTTWSN